VQLPEDEQNGQQGSRDLGDELGCLVGDQHGDRSRRRIGARDIAA
jgi:hypothetical protein